MASNVFSAADYLSPTTDSLLSGTAKTAGAGMAFPAALALGGLGAVGNIFGGIFQGRAQQRAADLQAQIASKQINAANIASLGNLYGQQMALGQNNLDRGYRAIADLQNIKAAEDARTDNYRYGMNAFAIQNEGNIQRGLIENAGLMRRELAGRSMDAINSVINTNNQLRLADNAFALGALERRDAFELQKEAGKFKAFFQDPMETAELGRRRRQDIAIGLSPEARELSRKERKGRIEEAVAIQRGVLDKMFGNYTPTFYG